MEPMPYWDSNASTAITVQRMCQLIHKSARGARFAGAAAAVPFLWGRMQSPVLQLQNMDFVTRKVAAVCIADWFFAKHLIHFVHDQELTKRLLGRPDALEALMAPEVMIEIAWPDRAEGDCDCFSMFTCALLECQRIPWEIVTLMCSPKQPGIWSHVYPRAVIGGPAGGMRLPLDASHGKYPGWSVPARDIERMQVWGMDGRPVGQQAQEEVI